MAFEFKLPDIGEGVVEGEIVKWHIKPGDAVAEDQPMVEVMTDKATVVIPSPRAGTVRETRGKEGAIAKVGEVLVVIDEAGAKAEAPKAAEPASKAAPKASPPGGEVDDSPQVPSKNAPKPTPSKEAPRAASPAPVSRDAPTLRPAPAKSAAVRAVAAEANAVEANGRPVLAAPATRRLARELNVDLRGIEGSGPGGRVTSEDVRQALSAPEPEAASSDDHRDTVAPPPPTPVARQGGGEILEERIPVRGLRKRIFENMAKSKSHAAHFTFVEECDCTQLVALRERMNGQLREGEAKLQYLPFIVKAVIAALKQYPDLNGHIDEQAMEFSRRKDFHIGVAASSERGLIVPVVRNADRRSLLDLSNEIKRLGDTARAGRLGAEDLGGSTFTITSLGKDGGIFATPIINHPEVAIMGVHKMNKRAMVNEEDDSIVVKPMMNLSLSFDHRMIDGHIGAAFTYTVIRLLQSPDRLLLEMS